MLLWTDPTTGLAHCYESDKCQPGKPWYARSLAFHDWLARELRMAPGEMGAQLDWLFRKASAQLAAFVDANRERVAALAAEQVAPYAGRDFPKPGEDPKLEQILGGALAHHFATTPSRTEWGEVIRSTRQHIGLENKRKNLVGEGFEDVLAAVVAQAAATRGLDVRTRSLLGDLPGFQPPAEEGDKPQKVDLAILPAKKKRVLVTAKWSIRSDREKQFEADYLDYTKANTGKPFDYVVITNEFDPARLARACGKVAGSNHLFAKVVHINPAGLAPTYAGSKDNRVRRSVEAVAEQLETGRLISLGDWLSSL